MKKIALVLLAIGLILSLASLTVSLSVEMNPTVHEASKALEASIGEPFSPDLVARMLDKIEAAEGDSAWYLADLTEATEITLFNSLTEGNVPFIFKLYINTPKLLTSGLIVIAASAVLFLIGAAHDSKKAAAAKAAAEAAAA